MMTVSASRKKLCSFIFSYSSVIACSLCCFLRFLVLNFILARIILNNTIFNYWGLESNSRMTTWPFLFKMVFCE